MASPEKTDPKEKAPDPEEPETTVAAGDGEVIDIDEITAILGDRGAKKFDAEALAKILKKKVIGQDKVADQVTSQIKRRLAQIELSKKSGAKIEKPLGVFLLAGPPGTGKTYFSKVLAENMYEGKGRILHVDMSNFRQPEAIWSLTGSPGGYTGGEGSLTSALVRDPKVIVLLDEFEKAHVDVQKVFLTAWNDGFITDVRTQKRIATTQSLFMLTTNAAMDRLVEIEVTFKDDPDGRNKAIIEALKAEKYAPEVLSRIDKVFVFAALDDANMARLAAVEIQVLAKKYDLKVAKIDTDYLVMLITKGEAFAGGGARELGRILESQLGDQMLDAQVDGAEFIRISLVEDKPFVRKVEAK